MTPDVLRTAAHKAIDELDLKLDDAIFIVHVPVADDSPSCVRALAASDADIAQAIRHLSSILCERGGATSTYLFMMSLMKDLLGGDTPSTEHVDTH